MSGGDLIGTVDSQSHNWTQLTRELLTTHKRTPQITTHKRTPQITFTSTNNQPSIMNGQPREHARSALAGALARRLALLVRYS